MIEYPKLRTLNSNTYRHGSGLRSEFHVGHVNYQVLGVFERIDPRLTDSHPDFYEMSRGNYLARIAKMFNHAEPWRFTNGWHGHSIDLRPVGLAWDTGQSIGTPQAVAGKLIETDGFLPEQTLVYSGAFGNGLDARVQARGPALVREVGIESMAALGSVPLEAKALLIPFEIGGTAGFEFLCADGLESWDAKSEKRVLADKAWKLRAYGKDSFLRPMMLRDSAGISRLIEVMWRVVGGQRQMVKVVPLMLLQKAKFPIWIDDTVSYFGGAGDGYARATNAVYNTARSAATGVDRDVTSTGTVMGQRFVDPNCSIYRTFLPTDTSALPNTAIITSADFYLWCASDVSTTDFNYALLGPTTQADPTTIGVADYNDCGALDDPPLWSELMGTNGISTVAYTKIALNAAGLAGISKTGYTLIGGRSQEDFASPGSAPTGDEYLIWNTSEQTGTDKNPYLSVIHTEGMLTPGLLGRGCHIDENLLNLSILA